MARGRQRTEGGASGPCVPRRIGVTAATLVITMMAPLAAPASLLAAEDPAPATGRVHAVLINGGQRPSANYLSHLHHLEAMVDLLLSR